MSKLDFIAASQAASRLYGWLSSLAMPVETVRATLGDQGLGLEVILKPASAEAINQQLLAIPAAYHGFPIVVLIAPDSV